MSAAYSGLTVHVLGSDAGVCAAFNGGTHMPLEDAAMYLSIPETTVLDPADYAQLASITRQLPGITKGVTYTRFVRKGIIKVYEDGSEFPIGKGVVLHESDHDAAAILTSGIMVDEAVKARRHRHRRKSQCHLRSWQCGCQLPCEKRADHSGICRCAGPVRSGRPAGLFDG